MGNGRPKGKNQDSVFYNKSKNRWVCAYYVIDNETHLQVRKDKTFKTEEEAKEFLGTIQYQKGNELFIKYNGIPLGQLMRTNLQRKLDMNLIGERQYARVLKTIEVIEKNEISTKKINDITSDDIQMFLNSFKEYSNSYIKKITEQFSQAYTLAFNKGYITKNPMADVIRPKSLKPDKEVRALTVEEQEIFTKFLMNRTIEEEPYKNVFLLQMYMGLRVGEALALRNGDFNLKNNLVYINKTLTTDKNDKVIMGNTTKTYAGIREIPIPVHIRKSLMEQLELSKNNLDNQLFLSTNGNYVDNRNVNRRLKEILKEYGITGISTHSLRHTYRNEMR